jgi:hypothetical protein
MKQPIAMGIGRATGLSKVQLESTKVFEAFQMSFNIQPYGKVNMDETTVSTVLTRARNTTKSKGYICKQNRKWRT